MLGLFERTPRFVKRYDNLAEQIGKAAETYADGGAVAHLPVGGPDLPAQRRQARSAPFAFADLAARRCAASFRSSGVGKEAPGMISSHFVLRQVLALPTDSNDTFLREVDENLRRDQLQDFFKKYGKWIAGRLVLFLGRCRRLDLLAGAAQTARRRAVRRAARHLHRHRAAAARRTVPQRLDSSGEVAQRRGPRFGDADRRCAGARAEQPLRRDRQIS